jgi:hypothetical protein
MRKNTAVLAALAAAGLLLSGCGVGGVTNTPNSPAPAAALATPAATTPAATTPAPAKVGDSITLKGNTPGSEVTVVVTKVVDPTTSTDQFSTPAAGSRYVAIQFQINNTGTAAYSDSPSNGAKVADSLGQQFDSSDASAVAAGPMLPSSVKLMPGDKALGYIVFEVPTASKVSMVPFGTDSGFGGTGEWQVG